MMQEGELQRSPGQTRLSTIEGTTAGARFDLRGLSMKRHFTHVAIAGTAALALLLATGLDLGQALIFTILLACPVTFGVILWLEHRLGADLHRPVPGSSSPEVPGDRRTGDRPRADSR